MSQLETLIEQYIAKFGGYPYPLFRGASDDYIISTLKKALESGKEIEPPDEADY